ncbi:MAG: hypothetical protein ACR2HQ_08895 [Ilumatobacteraceae bacterium]
MARPLVPPPPLPPPSSPLRRPAASGRPVLRSGVRTHQRPTAKTTLPAPQRRVPPPLPAEVRSRNHGSGASAAERRRPAEETGPIVVRDGVQRRRANVLFVLVLIAACSMFLAATMQTESLYYVAGFAFVGLCAYVYFLAHRRKREIVPERRQTSGPPRLRRPDQPVEAAEMPERRDRSPGPTVRYEERQPRRPREPTLAGQPPTRRRREPTLAGQPPTRRRRELAEAGPSEAPPRRRRPPELAAKREYGDRVGRDEPRPAARRDAGPRDAGPRDARPRDDGRQVRQPARRGSAPPPRRRQPAGPPARRSSERSSA